MHDPIRDLIKNNLKKFSFDPYVESIISRRLASQLIFDPVFTFNTPMVHPDDMALFLNNWTSNYLNPSLRCLHDPFLMKDMNKAADRIIAGLLNNEKICVYGDYDVDGITSISFLVLFLRELKNHIAGMKNTPPEEQIIYKIPDRIKHGYGLGIEPINEVIFNNDNGGKTVSLIVTVDLGITNVESVAYANSRNIDVIICDHHEIPEKLPEAYAILNPKQPDDKFPFKFLPGAGIAFNLAIALRKKMVYGGIIKTYPNLKNFLDIVCLGIIADIVPMYDENRILVHHGLKKINDSPRTGIKALKKICGLHFDNVNEFDVAWKMAPRINSAGRIGDPSIAVELLISDTPENAKMYAEKIELFNKKRQELENDCFSTALKKAETRLTEHDNFLILCDDSWHPGVTGIASSKLAEHFKRPVLLLSGFKPGIFIGSARTYGDIDIYGFLKNFDQFYLKFGGHKTACGLTLSRDIFSKFLEGASHYLKTQNSMQVTEKKADYEEEINLKNIKKELISGIKIMAPFGNLNERPKFLMRNVILENIKNSANTHFTCDVLNDRLKSKAFLFSKGDLLKNSYTGSNNLNQMRVNGIIFEFFNDYIKILNILT